MDPTAFADETARQMREYYELNRPRLWPWSKEKIDAADNLMLGLQQIVKRRDDEWRQIKAASVINRLRRIRSDFHTTRLTHQYSIDPQDLVFLLDLTENKA